MDKYCNDNTLNETNKNINMNINSTHDGQNKNILNINHIHNTFDNNNNNNNDVEYLNNIEKEKIKKDMLLKNLFNKEFFINSVEKDRSYY